MKTNEIIEGNKLIAEFMGLESKPLAKGLYQIQYKYSFTESGFNEWINEEMMKFNSSWDWLMPVVEKIENDVKHQIRIYGLTCSIDNFIDVYMCNTKIEAVWLAVVEFIKWYNNQNK